MWPVQAGVRLQRTNFLPEHHAVEQLDEYAHYKSPAFDSIMAETLKATARRSAQLCTLKQNNSWIRIRHCSCLLLRECASGETVGWWLTGKDPLDNTYTRNMYIVKHYGNTWGRRVLLHGV